MLAGTLAAFVAGVLMLQPQAAVPSPRLVAALALPALLLGALALRARRMRDVETAAPLAAVTLLACVVALG